MDVHALRFDKSRYFLKHGYCSNFNAGNVKKLLRLIRLEIFAMTLEKIIRRRIYSAVVDRRNDLEPKSSNEDMQVVVANEDFNLEISSVEYRVRYSQR